MLIVPKSGSLKLLEPSGLDQVCNGIAIPLLFLLLRRVTLPVFLNELYIYTSSTGVAQSAWWLGCETDEEKSHFVS